MMCFVMNPWLLSVLHLHSLCDAHLINGNFVARRVNNYGVPVSTRKRYLRTASEQAIYFTLLNLAYCVNK